MATGTIERPPSAFGFGGDGILLTSADDLDNILASGHYYWYSTTPSNAPITVSHCGLDVSHGGPNTMQRVYRGTYGTPAYPFEYVRFKYSNNAWTDWTKVAVEEDILSHITPETGVTFQKAKRIGNLVLLQFISSKITTANTYQTCATIDSGYRPAASHVYGGVVQCASGGDFGYGFCQVNSNGSVACYYSKATSYGLICTMTYYIGS